MEAVYTFLDQTWVAYPLWAIVTFGMAYYVANGSQKKPVDDNRPYNHAEALKKYGEAID